MSKWTMRFSLRTAFIFLTLICVWFGYRVYSINTEENAIKAIKAANGTVKYGRPWHPQYGGAYQNSQRERLWLTRFIFGNGPDNSVCTVFLDHGAHQQVNSKSKPLNDSSFENLLPHLLVLQGLKELRLDDTQVTSESIARLAQLKTLEVLDLCNVQVDDAAIDSLVSLSALRYLDIFQTEISLDGAERIQAALPNCTIRGPVNSMPD